MTRQVVQILIGMALIAAAVASWVAAGRFTARAEQHARVMTFQEPAASSSLVIDANAEFRKAQREANGLTTERLDQILQAYAGAIRNDGFNVDAAFNYEYLARLRDTMAKSPRRAAPRAPTSDTRDDLPSGPTIHGRPGNHPPDTRGEEFEVLTPMDYGEREAQPEPTPGRPRPRKG